MSGECFDSVKYGRVGGCAGTKTLCWAMQDAATRALTGQAGSPLTSDVRCLAHAGVNVAISLRHHPKATGQEHPLCEPKRALNGMKFQREKTPGAPV